MTSLFLVHDVAKTIAPRRHSFGIHRRFHVHPGQPVVPGDLPMPRQVNSAPRHRLNNTLED